jgi:endo-1,4-beta-xylanase
MTDITRRGWMALAAAVPLARASAAALSSRNHVLEHRHILKHTPGKAAGTAPDSLNGMARAKGLRFGSCVGTGPSGAPGSQVLSEMQRAASFNDPRVRALLVAQCGMLVPENELKWYALRPSPDKFDFRRADILADFADQHQIAVRGHTLLWNRAQWFPDWVAKYDFGANPAKEAERMLREHITTVCNHYGDRIFAYDVINETIMPDTGELADSMFTKYLGANVVDIAFHAAREAAPHAQLVYNDYMSWGPKDETHRAGVLKLLDRMKKNGVPIDALGVQSHIGTSNSPGAGPGFGEIDEGAWRKFLDEVAGMGLDIVITEFDVHDQDLPADIAQRDKEVADLGKWYLDIMTSYPQLRYVMAWGLVDKYSWLQHRTPRADGLEKRPCPYDDNFKPKPLRNAIAAALSGAPARPDMNMKPA